MKAWEFLTPNLVVMVSSLGEDNKERCSPFSWIVPLNKGLYFGIMMRCGSKTLENVLRSKVLAVSIMPGTPETAQQVLLTKRPKDPFVFNLKYPPFFRLAVPDCAIFSMDCDFMGLGILPVIGVDDTHQLAVCKMKRWMDSTKNNGKRLMHLTAKEFAYPVDFEVEGY